MKSHRRKTRTSRDLTDKRRFHFTLWGRSPGYGFESGWTFGNTPASAVKAALADASRYSRHKWKLPANVYLQEDGAGESFAFYVAVDGTITKGQGPRSSSGRDASRSYGRANADLIRWMLREMKRDRLPRREIAGVVSLMREVPRYKALSLARHYGYRG